MYRKIAEWVSSIHAIAQNGLTYCHNDFDKERYQELSMIASEIAAESSDLDRQTIRKKFAEEIGYMTPKVDLRAAVFQDDKILLVKERSDKLWTLPGGWADVNESPSEGIEREVLEETGFTTKAKYLIGFFDKLKHDHPPQLPHTYKVFFQCDIIAGTPKANLEISEIDFFTFENIPQLSLHRITHKQIRLCFDFFRNHDKLAAFD